MPHRHPLQNIPIGLIGPEDFLPKMREILKGFPSFNSLEGAYRHVSEAPRLAEELMRRTEVLLFTGPIPYLRAKEAVHFSVPAHYIPLTGAGLYRALFSLARSGKLQTLSVDTLPEETVNRTISDLDGETVQIVHSGEAMSDTEAIVRFHLELYRSGRTTAALTAVRSVSRALNEAGVPNEWIVPTDQDIVVALERALLSTETRRSKEAQIVLGLIHIDDYGRQSERRSTELESQKLRLDLSRLLLDYVESLDGHLTHFGGDEYLFVTTRGSFERETGGYKYMPLAGEMEKTFGLTLSIGVGFGSSAGVAGTHARAALRQAKEAGGNLCFIVREDEGLIGPLEMTRPQAFNLSLIDPALLEKTVEGGMSESYLTRLAAQAAQKGKIDYLAQELAAVLGITVRSAHRCLLGWTDAGLVEIAGEDRSATKGRPRQIYRFAFLADLLVRKK